MKTKVLGVTAVALVSTMLASGCNKKKDDSGNLKTAINSYYDAHPDCLW